MMQKLMKLGYNPLLGIDFYFLTKAKNRKTVMELETVEYQSALLTKYQAFISREALQDESSMKEEMDNIIRCWKAGDTANMANILNKRYEAGPESRQMYEELVIRRIRILVKK